jgi:proton-dependent oligopeptide transporter, POT family
MFKQLRSGFSSTFWIANTLELFERLAFYGSKAILAVYIAESVGLENAGWLTGFFSFLIFFLPPLAGVVVDRYGFRKSLVACFAIFCVGYFLIGFTVFDAAQPLVDALGKGTYMYVVLIITAIGGSLIKPCIVGTVSKTSTSDSKALGFSIYYSLVNLGGFLGPLVAMVVREGFGIESVLFMSSLTSFLLCIGALLFFKEPRSAQEESSTEAPRTFGQVFSNMLMVFSNAKFMLFLIIFSGFWVMFWHIFLLLPFYGTKVLNIERFEVLETIDAFGIILLTVPITALVRKWKPFTAMTFGFLIASLSWIVLGVSQTLTATFIGVFMFALGEAMQAPRFYEYVSSLAPKGQIGTFMGFAFLPVAIGALVAGKTSDWLRLTYLDSDPAMMWYILGAIGIVSTLLMIIYNAIFTAKSETTNTIDQI